MANKIRRRLIIGAGALAALAVVVIGGTYLYINVISGDAPAPLTLETGGTDGGDGNIDVAGYEGTWVVGEGSEAGYRVDEVLNGQDNTVVGRTSNVSGEVTVSNGVATAAEVVVDMTTVTTDSDARDSQFQGSIMLTEQFPTSTFTLTEPVDLSDLAAGGPVSLEAVGELTVRDITREVSVTLDIQVSGEKVQVAGSAPVTFADFGIEAPNLGFVRVEDEGIVEFLLSLEPA